MANTPRLVQLLKSIRDGLQQSLIILKVDGKMPCLDVDSTDVGEAVLLLREQGLSPAAVRLKAAWDRLASRCVDVWLANAAEGEPQDYRDRLTEVFGPFPENLDDATDRRILLAGHITQALDFVDGLIKSLGPPSPSPTAPPPTGAPKQNEANAGTGSTAKKTRPTKTPTIPKLSERQYNILQAMLELGAVAVQDRTTTERIALKAEGKQASPEQFKRPMSDLKKRKLVGSQDGRDGGSWLTDKGRTVAELLKNKDDTKQ